MDEYSIALVSLILKAIFLFQARAKNGALIIYMLPTLWMELIPIRSQHWIIIIFIILSYIIIFATFSCIEKYIILYFSLSGYECVPVANLPPVIPYLVPCSMYEIYLKHNVYSYFRPIKWPHATWHRITYMFITHSNTYYIILMCILHV